MTLLVDDVIDNARDMHPLLSRENVPDTLMLRELSRAVSDFYDQIFMRVPSYLATTVEIDLSDPAFNWAGVMWDVPGVSPAIDLGVKIAGGWKDLPKGEFWYSSGGVSQTRPRTATFIPWEQREIFSGGGLAFTFRDNCVYFLGSQSRYAQFQLFRLIYTPKPADCVLGGTVALQDDAREPLASRLASFGLMRMTSRPELNLSVEDVTPHVARASAERKEFLNAIFNITRHQRHYVRDVRPDPGGFYVP